MRNPPLPSGVYSSMKRWLPFLLLTFTSLAQPLPKEDPLDAAIRTARPRDSAHFQDAAAAREQARTLLDRAPVTSPRFAGWAQQVAQLYQSGNFNAQGRAVLEQALARTVQLGESHPAHVAMLNALGEAWRQDGNLLKAVGYLEQAAAAQAAAPQAQATGVQRAARVVISSGPMYYSGPANAVTQSYLRLAQLYQDLGRPEAVAAIAAKIRALGANDQSALAAFYEQRGQNDEAAAIYRDQAAQAANPQAKANAWQSVANLDARQQRYTDAVADMQQAITAAGEPSANPGNYNQSIWLRQSLATYLRDAGSLDQADEVYRQLLQETRGGPQETQMLSAYAQYLTQTKRDAQAATVLDGYLTDHPSLDPPEKMTILFGLANSARQAGDAKRATAYQDAAQALQQTPTPPAGEIRIAAKMQDAQAAASQHRVADAFRLAIDAIDSAPQAADGQQVVWAAPQVAIVLAGQKESAKAEQILQRLFAASEIWRASTLQPLVTATQSYVRYLESQPERAVEAPAAIEQYRRLLLEANGPDSARLTDPVRMRIDFARSRSDWPQAGAAVRELLEMQESLSGNTSDEYLSSVQTAAQVYQGAGDLSRALPLYRKAIALSDLLATPNNAWRRAQTRLDAAMALARAGQFEEAQTLAEEARAVPQTSRGPIQPVEQQIEQIRRMKQAAANNTHRGL